MPFDPIVVLDSTHDRDAFHCGSDPLDTYLRQYAMQNQKRGTVRNYVVTRTGQKSVLGYYSLVYSAVRYDLLPPRVVKGLGKHDIPAMLLARLAVDVSEQGQGLGTALLKDAIIRTMKAAEIAGLKLLLVHAKDETASAFYEKHGFVAFNDTPLSLYLPVELT